MSDYLSVKLDYSIINVYVPDFTTTEQANFVERTRTLSDSSTRTISDSSNRTINDRVTSYPELSALKLDNSIITVLIP